MQSRCGLSVRVLNRNERGGRAFWGMIVSRSGNPDKSWRSPLGDPENVEPFGLERACGVGVVVERKACDECLGITLVKGDSEYAERAYYAVTRIGQGVLAGFDVFRSRVP